MEYSLAFGVVLRRLRRGAGLTQEQLGFEADIRRTFVSLLELGQQQPTLTTIFKMSNALKTPPSVFMKMVEDELNLVQISN
jgi:transcriptional regulator with XRE-family HTH domain